MTMKHLKIKWAFFLSTAMVVKKLQQFFSIQSPQIHAHFMLSDLLKLSVIEQ